MTGSLLRFLAAGSMLAACALAGAAEPIPLANFFRNADVSFVKLSPSGRFVAILNRLDDGKQALVVRDTADLKKVVTVASLDTVRVLDVDWVNDKRLSFRVKNERREFESNYDQFAVDRDGNNTIHLIAGSWNHQKANLGSNIQSRLLTADYVYQRPTHDGSDDIIVGRYTWNNIDSYPQSMHPYRLNTTTRTLTDIASGAQPDHVLQWLYDSADQPRVAIADYRGRCIVHYRAEATGPWTEISNRDCVKDPTFAPLHFDSRETLYVRAGYKGRTALFTYDLKKKEMSKEPLVDIEGFDFNGSVEQDYAAGKVIGIHFMADATSTAWLEPRMQAIQDSVNALLPGTINRISCGLDCTAPPAVLVKSTSDRMPPSYFIYTPASKQLVGLGSSNPAIDVKQMGKRDFFRFAARDGLQIPVYVTMPAAKASGPRPAIVLVHGGPYVRGGSWEWDEEAQFLASRGYLVLQPEFRGSTGFGSAHYRAGWQQWGRAMQDDLADTAAWAVQKGWADPKRIGIMGASYGGYAVLMGLARHPDTFRAGVEWAGVTDIPMMFSLVESDATQDDRNYGMKTLIGDPDKDAAALAEVSPLVRAASIRQPLLMAHGAQDKRVPVAHATRFRDAVKATNPKVDYVIYPEEGHGWRDENTRIDFWQRVERFLDKNMGP